MYDIDMGFRPHTKASRLFWLFMFTLVLIGLIILFYDLKILPNVTFTGLR